MKQYAGDEIVRIMTDMPATLVEALQGAYPEHRITEHEARWWGFLQFARTDAYDGETFAIRINGTDAEAVQSFLPYVLSVRGADQRAGLVRRPWPESGFDRAG